MLGALRAWLDPWRGIGDVERGRATSSSSRDQGQPGWLGSEATREDAEAPEPPRCRREHRHCRRHYRLSPRHDLLGIEPGMCSLVYSLRRDEVGRNLSDERLR